MRRREFIGGIGVASLASPLVARAQQPAKPVVGFIAPGEPSPPPFMDSFRRGLGETGFVEGQNMAIEYRWANGHYERLPDMAAELVRLHPAAIVAITAPAALAVKAATSTIPIEFGSGGGDPVALGLVASFNRPGGNATGVNPLTSELDGKRLGLLHELVPAATEIGALSNPAAPNAASHVSELQAAARTLGLRLRVIDAGTEAEIDKAFEAFAQQRPGALFFVSDFFLSSHADRCAALAARLAIPAMYEIRISALAGGLISYGPDLVDVFRLHGINTGKMLRGENPRDMPVVQAVKFELIINLKTAKALGIAIPPTLLARADEVIE
ncbi:MAG TPA: ABC transporter substrate-binding protein [Stellaceae bacterium]|nr:ABC transporter substrate-binding protein [Stellaceae bacterium]